MYDPNDEKNVQGNHSDMNNSSINSYGGKDSETSWEGGCYHSGSQHNDKWQSDSKEDQSSDFYSNSAPGYQNPAGQNENSRGQWHQNTWQASNTQPPVKNVREKKSRSGKKGTAKRILACVLICFLVSAATLGGFIALVNNNVIKFGNSGSSSVFTVNKLINDTASGAANTSSTGTTQLLTKQQVAAKVTPAVVCIENYQNTTSNFSGYSKNQQGGSTAGNTASSSDGDVEGTPSSEGSGIIATSDGYIITNAHVVDGATGLKVILSDGSTYQAKLVGSDSVTDLALLKIDATGLTAAEFGSSSDLQVGDDVLAIGNPGGTALNSTVTFGNVSALERQITTSSGYTMKFIQTDAAINPGNSGGALVNLYGQVIGINSNKYTEVGDTTAEGLGFAIPIDTAQPVINDLKQYGYVKDRAMLGVTGTMVDSMTARFYNLQVGYMIESVSNDSLKQAGLQKGDIITKIDDTNVTSSGTITNVVVSKKPGDTVTLEVYHASSHQTSTVTATLIQVQDAG